MILYKSFVGETDHMTNFSLEKYLLLLNWTVYLSMGIWQTLSLRIYVYQTNFQLLGNETKYCHIFVTIYFDFKVKDQY